MSAAGNLGMRPLRGSKDDTLDSHERFLRCGFAASSGSAGTVGGGADLRRLERPRRPDRPFGVASESSCSMVANKFCASTIRISFGDWATECDVLQVPAGEGKPRELPRELRWELRAEIGNSIYVEASGDKRWSSASASLVLIVLMMCSRTLDHIKPGCPKSGRGIDVHVGGFISASSVSAPDSAPSRTPSASCTTDAMRGPPIKSRPATELVLLALRLSWSDA